MIIYKIYKVYVNLCNKNIYFCYFTFYFVFIYMQLKKVNDMTAQLDSRTNSILLNLNINVNASSVALKYISSKEDIE